MTVESHELRAQDMIGAIQEIVARWNPELFESDDLLRSHVLFTLHRLGEGARLMPQVVRARYPEVPWRQLEELPSMLTHHYRRVQPDQLGVLIAEDLPGIGAALTAILAD